MRIGLLTILFGIFFSQIAFSQSKNLEKANQLFDKTSYPAAIEAYQKAVEEAPTSSFAITRLADCYRLTDDFRSALRWYAKAVKMKGVEGEVWFHFGEVLMINRKYPEAIPWLEKYQKKFPDDDRVAEMIASCQNQEAFAASKSLYLVRRLSINSESSDFGPAFLGKSVVFASSRKRTLLKYNRTGESFLDFYVAAYDGKPALGEPALFRGNLNTPVHEANACFTADGQEMYFTRNMVKKGQATAGKGDMVQLALYHAQLIDGKWENEELLPFNHDDYSCGHPALSPDGERLYFVSNMPGGAGGTDIYVVAKEGDAWGKPENLGLDINTQGNEMFPWVGPDGQLYFASNGRGGVGGLDLFQVDPRADVIGDPINLGAPVNSPYDDFGFILDAQAGIAFFTSNRLGGQGDDDLYAAVKLIRWEALVTDSTGAPLADALVDLREGRSRTQTTTDENGKFVLGLKPNASYLLLLKAPGQKDMRLEFMGNAAPEGILRFGMH
jgi:Carboxypeptidase regulatory-like domain/WD40-like Beta Propeller Repeat